MCRERAGVDATQLIGSVHVARELMSIVFFIRRHFATNEL